MKRKSIRKFLIGFALLIVGGSVWIWLASRQLVALTPSSNNVDFSTFAEQMPPPKRLAIIDEPDGTKRIVWVGEIAFMSIPSGPSCYVFDESGALVRWSASTGDGETTTQDGTDANQVQSGTIEDVKAIVNRR